MASEPPPSININMEATWVASFYANVSFSPSLPFVSSLFFWFDLFLRLFGAKVTSSSSGSSSSSFGAAMGSFNITNITISKITQSMHPMALAALPNLLA